MRKKIDLNKLSPEELLKFAQKQMAAKSKPKQTPIKRVKQQSNATQKLEPKKPIQKSIISKMVNRNEYVVEYPKKPVSIAEMRRDEMRM